MIVFTRELADRLLARALRESPEEACGVIAGKIEGGSKEAVAVYECANVDPDPEVAYEISPAELLRALDDAESKGLEVIGFYHSHPMALNKPSMVDESKATWPGHSYVIISPKSSPQITSWICLEGKGFASEEVQIKEPKPGA